MIRAKQGRSHTMTPGATGTGPWPIHRLVCALKTMTSCCERMTTTREPLTGATDGSREVTMWTVVVPVKLLAHAKSRLARVTGGHREQLALAVASDTVAAALRCGRVRTVVVVTDDPLAGPALEDIGARVVPDAPDSGLNPALRYGAGFAAGSAGDGIAALSADLPALRPAELARALDAAAGHPTAFVADAAGAGTTLYAAAGLPAFAPEFGKGSRGRHAAAGAYELDIDGIDSVRRDVDTLADLEEALLLGLGEHTDTVVNEMNGGKRQGSRESRH